jgi:hypothetical protein
MTKTFEAFGPYEIDRDKVFKTAWQKDGWEYVNRTAGGKLSDAIGIYVFSLRNGRNYKPIYVGITMKQKFSKEVFNQRNLRMISQLNSRNGWMKGTICLHLLGKRKERQVGFARPRRDWLEALEALMIFICRRKNPNLLNQKHTARLDGVGIGGITSHVATKGKPSNAISTLRNVMDW